MIVIGYLMKHYIVSHGWITTINQENQNKAFAHHLYKTFI